MEIIDGDISHQSKATLSVDVRKCVVVLFVVCGGLFVWCNMLR